MSESVISDLRLKTLWKQAVTASLSPDNNYPAYKLYYILLKKEIVEKCNELQITETDENNLI